MRVARLLILVLLAQSGFAAEVERHLQELRDDNPEVRIAALRELQTSLDPRIPDAMLPLLEDTGDSIRRLAARAIGSRWWQIPAQQVPQFLAALKQNLASDHDGEKGMAERAVGLLRRDYSGDMFVRSANGRWVIYERRGLPCLIDTRTGTEELLGWGQPVERELGKHRFQEGAIDRAAYWHGSREAVAFDMSETRHSSYAWVWRHRLGLRKLTEKRMLNLADAAEGRWMHTYGFSTVVTRWRGDEVEIDVRYTIEKDDDYFGRKVRARWNPETGKLRVISRANE